MKNTLLIMMWAVLAVCAAIYTGCGHDRDEDGNGTIEFDPKLDSVFDKPTIIKVKISAEGQTKTFSVKVTGGIASNLGTSIPANALTPLTNGWKGIGEPESWALITPTAEGQPEKNPGKVILYVECDKSENRYRAAAGYTFKAAKPVFNPGSGGTTMILTSVTPGAKIYYTTDGTTPTQASTEYSGPISFSEQVSLAAVAMAPGYADSDVASNKAATPVFTPAGGDLASGATVTITSATPGAKIYYTIDDTTPTHASTEYSGPISISANLSGHLTVKAMAMAPWYADSDVSVANYSVSNKPKTAAPSFSPSPGVVAPGTLVTISSATPGSEIHFTTDGTVPNAGSPLYGTPIVINTTTVLKAFALVNGYIDSEVVSGTYTILPKAAAPSFSSPGGTVAPGTVVAISCSTPGCQIHYTDDGTEPTNSSPLYTLPIVLNTTSIIKAYATAYGYLDSDVTSAAYTVSPKVATPVFNPPSGTLVVGDTVTISSTTPGAEIHFTTDGTAPNAGSPIYSSAIPVTSTISGQLTVKAIAIAPEYSDSDVASVTYTVANAPFAEACAAWNAAFAERIIDCLLTESEYLAGRPGTIDCATLQEDITAGQTTYSGAHAADCTTAIADLPCSSMVSTEPGPLPFPMPGTACSSAIVGKGATATACHRDTQCASGYCTSTTSNTCADSTCQPRVSAGNYCYDPSQCEIGLTCSSTSHKCEAYPALNQFCNMNSDCSPEQRCLELSCQQPKGLGDACNLDSDCVAGAVCMNYACKAMVGLGGQCTPPALPGYPTGCAAGFWCDAGTNTCAALPKIGESCLSAGDCIGSYCKMEQSSGTCIGYLNIGDACSGDAECESLLCSADKCQVSGDFYCFPP